MIGRLLRRLRGQVPFLVVLALMALAFAYLLAWPDHWRRGTVAIAFSMAVAGLLRLLLPRHRVGLLDVRGRWIDAVAYLALAAAMFVVAIQLG